MQWRGRLIVGTMLMLLAGRAAAQVRTLHDGPSEFNDRIIVREDARGIRSLLFADKAPAQTLLDTKDPQRLVGAYSRVIMVSLAVVREPKRILIVGLGGGAMPMFLRRNCPEAHIDIAEIDPAVVDAARRFFGFAEDQRMKVHVGDGRQFIQETASRYDIIYLDAYGPDSMPMALATRQFMELVKGRLNDGGIVAANVWASGSPRLYASMVRTYQAVFPELHVIRVPLSDSRIHLAMPTRTGLDKAGLIQKAAAVEDKLSPKLALRFLVESGYEPVERIKGGAVLEDPEQ